MRQTWEIKDIIGQKKEKEIREKFKQKKENKERKK